MARIIGTWIPVVADYRGLPDALAVAAGVLICTHVLVVTNRLIDFMDATDQRVAKIVRALVAIATRQGASMDTLPQMAMVTSGAEVIVVARCLIES